MDVSENSGTPKIIHFNGVFQYTPSISIHSGVNPILGNTQMIFPIGSLSTFPSSFKIRSWRSTSATSVVLSGGGGVSSKGPLEKMGH